MSLVLYAIATCLLTGLVEEALFRALLQPLLAQGFAEREARQPLRMSVLCTAALFALLHVLALPEGGMSALQVAQLACKFWGAGAFSVVASTLFVVRGGNWRAWLEVSVFHAAVDLVLLAPGMLATGSLPESYATGNLADLVAYALTALALTPLAIFAWKHLPEESVSRNKRPANAEIAEAAEVAVKNAFSAHLEARPSQPEAPAPESAANVEGATECAYSAQREAKPSHRNTPLQEDAPSAARSSRANPARPPMKKERP